MKRWHEEEHISKRRAKVWDIDYMTRSGAWPLPASVANKRKQLGRYRKKHPFDCGRAKCGICAGHKHPQRELSRNEQLANLNFKEQT